MEDRIIFWFIMISGLAVLLGPFWLMYRAYVLRLNSKTADADELKELKARVAELESQVTEKKVNKRLAVLEEIITSDEFDLKRRFREVDLQADPKRLETVDRSS